MTLNAIFARLAEMSGSALLTFLAALALRFLFRLIKAPARASALLLLVVVFRMLCPLEIPSPASIMNAKPVIEAVSLAGRDDSGAPQASITEGSVIPVSAPSPSASPPGALAILWLCGALAMGLYGLASSAALRRRVRLATLIAGNVYETDAIKTPFVLGVLRPRIYLPARADLRDLPYILAHERAHIAAGDHILKPLAYAAVCLHWMNPVLLLAFVPALTADMDRACDERVLRLLGGDRRADYSESLLRYCRPVPALAAPPAFSANAAASRIRRVLDWRRPKKWACVLAALLCALFFAACGTGAATPTYAPVVLDEDHSYIWSPEIAEEAGGFGVDDFHGHYIRYVRNDDELYRIEDTKGIRTNARTENLFLNEAATTPGFRPDDENWYARYTKDGAELGVSIYSSWCAGEIFEARLAASPGAEVTEEGGLRWFSYDDMGYDRNGDDRYSVRRLCYETPDYLLVLKAADPGSPSWKLVSLDTARAIAGAIGG